MGEILKYKTFSTPKNSSLYKEKGSKFIGYAFHVETEEEVKNALEIVKKKEPQARHYCYAYSLGVAQQTFKANDDGEPNNSAGMPIYNQILSFELKNVLIVVVRYFGGTKLGVSGLISAYKIAAQEIISLCNIKEIELQFTIFIQCDYAKMSNVHHVLNINEHKVKKQKLEQYCQYWVQFPLKNKAPVIEMLTNYNLTFKEVYD